MKQYGGTIGPARPVPPFTYTDSPDRRAWIKMMYPYMPYLANVLREIPWGTFTYKDDKYDITSDVDPPYMIVGGAACEFLDDEYKSILSKSHRLHAFADPTADIDVRITGPRLNTPTAHETYEEIPLVRYKDKTLTLEPPTTAYLNWLLDHIESFLKGLSYNFKNWFPDAVFDDSSVLKDVYPIEGMLRTVGPFHLYAIPNIDHFDDEGGIILQLTMAYKVDGRTVQNHCMEIILNPISTNPDVPDFITTKRGFYIDSLPSLLWYTANSFSPDKIKTNNYNGRAIFLGNLIAHPKLYPTVEHTYYDEHDDTNIPLSSLYFGLTQKYMDSSKTPHKDRLDLAKDLLQQAPIRFRRDAAAEYKQLCKIFGVSYAIPAKRKTPKQRFWQRGTRKRPHGGSN